MGHYVQAVTLRWYNACAYYAVSLSQGLRVLGHKVTFAGGSDTPAVKKAREAGIDVLESQSVSSSLPFNATSGPFSQIKIIQSYRKFALEKNVTLVNVHHGRDHLMWAFALRGTGIPLIRTSGNQIPPKKHPGSQFLMRKKTAGIIASCKTVRGYYTEKFGFKTDDIPVINGGVDSVYYSIDYPPRRAGELVAQAERSELSQQDGLIRKTLGIPEDAFVFGILGRFSPDKGHAIFFRAAEIVAKHHPEAWFLVAGWNAQLNEKDMRAMASMAGISGRTRFCRRYPGARDIIASLDVGVIASLRSEMICRIAMEYMAMCVPVVAADTNVIPEIIRHSESGIIVPAGKPRAMAYGMAKMIEQKGKSRLFGQRGREIVEKCYSFESFAEKTIDAYRSFTIRDEK